MVQYMHAALAIQYKFMKFINILKILTSLPLSLLLE